MLIQNKRIHVGITIKEAESGLWMMVDGELQEVLTQEEVQRQILGKRKAAPAKSAKETSDKIFTRHVLKCKRPQCDICVTNDTWANNVKENLFK